MAMTASIALSNAAPGINQSITAYVTISNSGASAVTVSEFTPTCTPAMSATLSAPFLSPNVPVSVPASGSVVLNYSAILSAAGTYALGAAVSTSDGSNFSPSTTNAVVPAYSTSAPVAPSPALAITSLTGDVTASGPGAAADTIVTVGGVTAANVATGANLANAAVSANTVSTIMKRDASGHAALGVLELASVAITDKASGGSIGSAATTVDIASVALCNQTTAAQTLTLPTPTSATPIRLMYVVNVGSASFTVVGASVAAGAAQLAMWNGSAWIAVA